jgi:transposase
MNSERRHLTPQEKVAALKRRLLEKVPVSEICDQLAIAPTLFYRWQKELFEGGHLLFENGRKAKAVEDANVKKIQQLEAKLTGRTRSWPSSWKLSPSKKKSWGTLNGCWVPMFLIAR